MNLVFTVPFARQILCDIIFDHKRKLKQAEEKLKLFDNLPRSVLDSGFVSEKHIFPEVFLDKSKDQE